MQVPVKLDTIADANGLATLTFGITPAPFQDIYSIATKCKSSGGRGEVYVGGHLYGYFDGAQRGWARGILAPPGSKVMLVMSNLLAADPISAYATIDRHPISEDLSPPPFEGSPLAGASEGSLFAFQETQAVTGAQLVAAPGAGKFIRVLGVMAGCTLNLTVAAAQSPLIQLLKGSGGALLVSLTRFGAPAATQANPTGFSVTPWIPLGQGLDNSLNTALYIATTVALTGGQVFANVEYTIIG